jgi:predicted RNA-binding Zn ribbon-like protein
VSIERWFEPGDGLEFVVQLLNSCDDLERDPELLRDAAVVERFLRRFGLDDAAALADETQVVAMRELRTRLRAAWTAPDDETAVSQLNDLAHDHERAPRLVREDTGWSYRWDRPGDPVSAFAPAKSAAALLDEIRMHGRRRLGVCVAGPCRCVFVDHSRGRTRRFCCTKCADRHNQAAWRRRQRSPS